MAKDLEIAVIDDDESFRVALVESLSSLGYGSDGYASAEDYIGSIGGKLVQLRCYGHSHARHERAGPDEIPRRSGFDDPRGFDHGTFGPEPRGQGRCGGRGVPAPKAV